MNLGLNDSTVLFGNILQGFEDLHTPNESDQETVRFRIHTHFNKYRQFVHQCIRYVSPIYSVNTQIFTRSLHSFDSVGPNPQIVRWAILEKNLKIDVQVLGVDKDGHPENRTPDMLMKNPAGTTPFIELDNGTVIAETYAICQYLDRIVPSRPFLTGDPSDPVKQAETTMWIERVKLQIVAPYTRQFQYGEGLPYFKRHVSWAEESAPSVPGLRKQVVENMKWLEENMMEDCTLCLNPRREKFKHDHRMTRVSLTRTES